MLNNRLGAPLQAWLARAFAESPRAQQLCRRLAGRSLLIEPTGAAAAFAGGARITSDGTTLDVVRVLQRGDTPPSAASATPAAAGATLPDSTLPDATLRGSPLALLGLLRSDAQTQIQSGAVSIEGDAEIARQFSELFALLKPDPEELLGGAIGRVPAHGVMTAAQGAFDYGRDALRSGSQALADWLAHERRELVSKPESEHHTRETETLGEQIDRVEARLGFLAERLAKLGAGNSK